MKKRICFLILLLSVIFAYFSIIKVNEEQVNHFLSYFSQEKRHYVMVSKGQHIDKEEYFDYLITALDKYSVNLYMLLDDETFDYILYCHTTDEEYLNSIVLANNKKISDCLDSLDYTNLSSDKEKRIYTFFHHESIAIKSFDLGKMMIEPANSFTLTASNDENIKLFIDDLNSHFEETTFTDNIITQHQHIDKQWNYSAFLLTMIIGLSINLYLMNSQKKISLLKIEGFSTVQILFREMIKPFIENIWLLILASLVTKIIIQLPLSSWACFNKEYYMHCILMIGSYSFCSILSFLLIKELSYNSAIKGKNKTNLITKLLTAVQIGLSVWFYQDITDAVSTVPSLVSYLLNNQHYQNSYKNCYRISTILHSGEYAMFVGTDKMKEIYTTLINDNGLFEFIDMNSEISDDFYYSVDVNYLKQQGINISTDEAIKYILFPQGCNEEDYKWIVEDLKMTFLNNEIEYEIINIDYPLVNYSSQFYDVDKYVDKPLLATRVGEDDYQIHNHLFYYNGNKEKAQEYLDDLFISEGIKPSLRVTSVADEYGHYVLVNVTQSLKNIIMGIVKIVILTVLMVSLIGLEVLRSEKKIEIKRIEGYDLVFDYNFIVDLVLNILLVFAMLSFLKLGTMKQIISYSILNGFILIIVLFIVTEKLSKNQWEKGE